MAPRSLRPRMVAAMVMALALSGAAADAGQARSFAVASAAAFAAAVAVAGPGDAIVIAAGLYADWHLLVPETVSGDAGRPIRIAPEKPGSVTFSGGTRLDIRGSHVEIAGFRFDRTGAPSVTIFGSHNRATGLEFQAAGNRRKPHAPILVLREGASDNEIDHCLFVGSASVSIQIRMPEDERAALPLRNRIHHNEFRDIPRYSKNGQEPIQVGQGPGGRRMLGTSVDHNLFVRADGDDELVSVKTSGNKVRYNIATDSNGGISLRGGDHNLVEGNVLLRTKRGIVVTGDDQTVINNFVDAPREEGILVAVGSKRYRAATNAVIAHNTIIRAKFPIRFSLRDPVATAVPRDNSIVNNILVARRASQEIVSANRLKTADSYLAGSLVAHNLFWWEGGGGTEAAMYRRDGNIVADPLIDLSDPLTPRLGDGSPARRMGMPGYAPTDGTGAARADGAAPDLGVLTGTKR